MAAGAASVSSFFTAAWERIFNQVELQVPAHAAAGSTFDARLGLIPYSTVENVTVKLSFSDRFYEDRGKEIELRTKKLDASELLKRGRLPGRRRTDIGAAFVAPFPMTKHTHMKADMNAGILSFFGVFVPALKFRAANLREHGGYVVEATVTVGWVKRKLHKRLLAYYIGEQIHFG